MMLNAFAAALFLAILTLVVGLFMVLFAKGKRRRGMWVATAALFVGTGAGIGMGMVADADAKAAGFNDYLDKISANAEGFNDPAAWADVRDNYLAQRNAKKAAKEAEEANAKAAAAAAPNAKEVSCRKDLICWGERQLAWTSVECRPEIEKLAKYRAKWLDGWPHIKFSDYHWLNKSDGTLTMIGDMIEFENGFGAGVNMVYQCDVDPDKKAILAVRAEKGRL